MRTTREGRARAAVERRARSRTIAARRFRASAAEVGYEVVDELVLDGVVRLVLDGPTSREFATTNRSGVFALVDHSLALVDYSRHETGLVPPTSGEGFLAAIGEGGRGTRAFPFPENDDLRELVDLRGRVSVEDRRGLLAAVLSGPDSHLRRREVVLRRLLLSSVGEGGERSGEHVRLAVRTLRDLDSGVPLEWVLRRGGS